MRTTDKQEGYGAYGTADRNQLYHIFMTIGMFSKVWDFRCNHNNFTLNKYNMNIKNYVDDKI